MSTEPIQMIMGALQVVDGTIIEKQQALDGETRRLSEDFFEAVLSRDEELLGMEFSHTSMLFANLSRYLQVL